MDNGKWKITREAIVRSVSVDKKFNRFGGLNRLNGCVMKEKMVHKNHAKVAGGRMGNIYTKYI